MSGNVWGADVAQLRTLAQQFSKTADLLQQQSTQLSGQINNSPAWKGRDAEHFRSDWNGNHRTLLQQTATRLKQESKLLLANADEQDRASSTGGAGGSAGPGRGGPGTGVPGSLGGQGTGRPPFNNPWGLDWLADPDSPFRDGWDIYNLTKALPNLRAGLFDLPHFIKRADSFAEFFSKDFRDVAKAFQDTNMLSQYFNTSSELFDGRWDTALNLVDGGKAATFFEFGGKALGVVGVGLDTLDAFNNFTNGNPDDNGGAWYSAVKAGLGVAGFVPPPVGTAAMVASGALAIYDNVPIVKETVNAIGESIADSAEAAWESAGDAAENVGDFFGF
ncbi:WXG100 family type VII secretion target [Pseudarthrobacter sp. NPDC092184]|uniref:WXG100 family type VII secretion target n=1 Tax=unclassified Pseudarthrobacter TaxID=2647000 RepID=UPI00381714F3